MTAPQFSGADAHIFQTEYYSHEFVVENTILLDPKHCPNIYVIFGPGRSCTTAMLAWLMSNPTIQLGYYQPQKTLIRHGLMYGSFVIPGKNQGVERIVIKDTLGPFSREFEEFDPVELLVKAGVPLQKISLILIMREPLATLKSNHKFEGGISPEMLISNIQYTWMLYEKYQRQVPVIPMANGLVGNEKASKTACEILGIPFHGFDFDLEALKPIEVTTAFTGPSDAGKFVSGEASYPSEWSDIIEPTFERGRLVPIVEEVTLSDFFGHLVVDAKKVQEGTSKLYCDFLELALQTLRV